MSLELQTFQHSVAIIPKKVSSPIASEDIELQSLIKYISLQSLTSPSRSRSFSSAEDEILSLVGRVEDYTLTPCQACIAKIPLIGWIFGAYYTYQLDQALSALRGKLPTIQKGSDAYQKGVEALKAYEPVRNPTVPVKIRRTAFNCHVGNHVD